MSTVYDKEELSGVTIDFYNPHFDTQDKSNQIKNKMKQIETKQNNTIQIEMKLMKSKQIK